MEAAEATTRPYRIGVDIGGTFTDAALVDESTGATWISKVSTTSRDPSAGFLEAMRRVLDRARIDGDDLRFQKPPPLVARHLCFDVPERVDAQGRVLSPLDEEAVRQLAGSLRSEGV